MGRRPSLIKSSNCIYHVYARSNNKDWFSIPLRAVWEIFTEVLAKTNDKYCLEIHLFVLMSNHFHALVSTPTIALNEAMRYLMTETSRRIGRSSHRINHVYGGRYRWTLLEDAYSHAYVYKYVLRNPVRAGLVANIEDYAWTSWRARDPFPDFPTVERIGVLARDIPQNPGERLQWLNLPTPKEQEELIALALRRYRFKLPNGTFHKRALESLKSSYGVDMKNDAKPKDDRHISEHQPSKHPAPSNGRCR